MKNVFKSILVVLGLSLAGTAFGQVELLEYKAVGVNNGAGNYQYWQPQQTQQPQPEYRIVGGYYYDRFANAYKRVKIKINSVSSYGQSQVYLRGVFNSSFNAWTNDNTAASKINAMIDGVAIANEFE
jgi:hypothetical protein